jgi:hypothetical protein
VTGTLSRYSNTSTSTNAQYSAGNFLFIETQTLIAATAHNWTVTYTNQANTGGQTFPSAVTGVSSAAAGRLDMGPTTQWFCTLAAGDTGISALTQMTCSAAVASGTINFVIGHPIAWLPSAAAFISTDAGGIVSALSLTRIIDGACLSLIQPNLTSGTANPNPIGYIQLVNG